ncbi:hypothetical protein Cgig2_029010 [Carnegiea gigantea]|uniref:Uncharacterized protein n=1 Tax=Carnegiea gigantea TaxID=171969 RepID=A0A9Q1JW45_9CARY|nr:hypothetical protein Cgig2_029010 [Carnegiea gigantea]
MGIVAEFFEFCSVLSNNTTTGEDFDDSAATRDKSKRQPKGVYRGPILFLVACVRKISRSLKNFARSIIEVVDVVNEAQQMFPASTQMDKFQGILIEILTNCSKMGKFKDTTSPSQTQPRDANVGHQATPSSQDDGLFVSNPSFWDACVELVKTYEKTSEIACPGTFTPPGFDLGFGFRLSQSVQVESTNQGGSGGTKSFDGAVEFSSPKYKKFTHILDSEIRMTSWLDFSNSKLFDFNFRSVANFQIHQNNQKPQELGIQRTMQPTRRTNGSIQLHGEQNCEEGDKYRPTEDERV